MAGKNLAVLGIDLQPDEIRVVEVEYRAGVPFVARTGRASIPPGSDSDASSVAKVLESLLESIGTDEVDRAVFGLPFERLSFRNLVIPPAPDNELPIIVAGEVEHYNLLKSRGASHAFFKLSPPGGTDIGVGVFGAEEEATSFVRDVASKANLTVEAVEPSTYAMCRTACIAAGDSATIATVMIGGSGSEIALLRAEGPIAYRRLDTGSRLLLSGQDSAEGAPSPLHLASAGNLATEIRRTLEYLERQYRDLNPADRLHLVVEDPALEPLAEFLQGRLDIPVELVTVTVDPTGLPMFGTMATDGQCPVAALGLALRSDFDSQTILPALDLFERQRSSAVQNESKRNLLGAVLVSAAALLIAILVFRSYGMRIQELDRDTAKSQVRTEAMESETNAILVARTKRAEQLKILRREGVPLAAIMDEISQSITPGVGLASVTVGTDQRIAVVADATAEAPMLQTVQRMQLQPLLKGPTIAMFQKNTQKNGITFQVSAQTVSVAQVRATGSVSRAQDAGGLLARGTGE